MFGDGPLTFWEFKTREPWPLATVQDAMLFEFLPGRKDVVLCGSQAVNAYVEQMRLTQDMDLVSTHAEKLTEEVKEFLHRRFHMELGIRTVRRGVGYRVDQIRKPKDRHLVDVRSAEALPPSQLVQEVLVLTPPELICRKVISMVDRTRRTKSFLDKADLFRLLLTFPYLKTAEGPVSECLRTVESSPQVMAAWNDLVSQEILPDDDESKFLRP